MAKIGRHRAYAVGYGVLEVLLAPVILAVIGDWGDRHFHTAPWLLIGAVVLGIGASVRGGWRLYRQAKKIMENSAEGSNGDDAP